MIVREQLNLGFGIGEKDEKIRIFSEAKQRGKLKKKNTSAGARVGSENNTAVVSDADDGGAHGVRGI